MMFNTNNRESFFVRNPAVRINGKIIFTQLTLKTTVLADNLTFEKSVITKSKFWTYFVKITHGFVYRSPFESDFNACFLSFSLLESPDISLCGSRKVFT